MKLYANIAKVEPQEDGTLKVYGYASSGAEDSDGEVVSPEAMKAAIPDYMKFGAVREMHQPLAAGTAMDIAVDDDGKTSFSAHIVDPVAVKKVSTQVYKGFSIGGKVTSRDPNNSKSITGLRLVEVSLVDRPANPEAVFTMYKAEKSPEEKAEEIEKAAISDIASLINSKALMPSQILKSARDSLEATLKAPPAKRVPIAFDTFKKGMYSVSCFAELLQSATYLADSAAYEAEYEADASKVPEELRAWVASGVGIFTAMAAEEAAELLASIKQPEAAIAVIESSEQPTDVLKAGATFSAASKKKLGDIHAAMKDCCDKMDALGYKDADDASMAAPSEAIKAEAAAAIAQESPADLAYKADLSKDAALAATIDALTKRLAVVEAQPAAPKGALRVVGKGEDVGAAISKGEIEIPENLTGEQRALLEIKKSFRTGGRAYTG